LHRPSPGWPRPHPPPRSPTSPTLSHLVISRLASPTSIRPCSPLTCPIPTVLQPPSSSSCPKLRAPTLHALLRLRSPFSCTPSYRAGAGIPFLKRAFAQNQELLAASAGNLEWLHHSLKHRKGIRSDCRGFTALHLAAERGHLDCVIALVDRYKFPLSMTTTKGWTPLHLAINKEKPAVSLKCIQFLLEKGAPVNVQNQNGVTPLHLAAWEGMLDCIKVLVKAGADVHALDRQNRKSIDLCRAWNHRECARFLKDAMWKQDKKDLAEEMGQLSQLKKRLLVMQNKYLLEKKVARGRKMAGKDRQILSWRASLGRGPVEGLEEGGLRGPSSLNSFAFRPGALSFYPSLKSVPVSKEPPRVTKEAAHMKKYPQVTNTKAEARPVTQIAFPQVVRLGVHPDTTPEPDLCNFLKFYPNGEGGAHIQTADGQWIFPVPRLPFKVLLRELCPSRRAQRLRVPEGLRRITVQDLPRRRYPGDQRFWTDSMAMSLRDTFDPAFISLAPRQNLAPSSPAQFLLLPGLNLSPLGFGWR
uniref:Uncharacterized protein n=1 Tax=Vombatus ursinus TaxID=29139 RepID=A0A4X2LPE3_VOMUR